MSGVFKFKQFSVDQSGCAMKINTDGVLLGALADADDPKAILDIGTGTGVIALMLAQRFSDAKIDAVEIDVSAAQTAEQNFANSPFAERLNIYPLDFERFFNGHSDKKYDLIVSNPPFFINSLKSPKAKKELAKHTDKDFFEKLILASAAHLTENGICCLILPVITADLVKTKASAIGLDVEKQIDIFSYKDSEAHRELLFLSRIKKKVQNAEFIIYDAPQVHSEDYRAALKDLFTIF